MPWKIMHRAAPCRNVPVTFTLDGMDERSFQREADGSWTSGVLLDGMEDRVRLVVRKTHGSAARKDVRAAIEVVAKWEQIRGVLAPALFAFYCRTESEVEGAAPEIRSSDEVWREVEVTDIDVFADESGHTEYVHVLGRCSWEEEHGLELVLRGTGELLYVGGYEGWVCGEAPSEHDWNFAIPKNQSAALAAREASREHRGRRTLAAGPREHDNPRVKLAPKAWWRFW